MGEIAGESGAEITRASGDENGIDGRNPEAGFLEGFPGGGFGKSGSVLVKAGHHGIGFKDKGIFDAIQSEMTGFDAVAVTEDFAKKSAGAGSQLMEFGGIFQGLENFGLSKGSWWNRGANGVEVHEGWSRKFKKVRWLT